MPDKKDKRVVTDPAILAEFNSADSPASAPKVVTDPDILSQFNSDETYPQKKSPVVSAPSSEASSQQQPAGAITNTPDAPANQAPTAWENIVSKVKSFEPQPATPQEQTHNATDFIAKHYLDNNAPASGDITTGLDKLTNPHSDPSYLAQYKQTELNKLQDNYVQQREGLLQMRGGDIIAERKKLDDEYQQQKDAIKSNADHIQSLQLFNKEYQDKRMTPGDAQSAWKELQDKKETYLDPIDKQLEDVQTQLAQVTKSAGPLGLKNTKSNSGLTEAELNHKFKELTIAKFNAEKEYNKEATEISGNTKYNPIEIGAEFASYSGDPHAAADLIALRQGKSIDPTRQYNYNVQGDKVMQTGLANVADEGVKKEVAPYVDQTGDQRFRNNKPYIVNKMGNQRYEDESGWRWLIPSGKWTPELVEQYGQKIGLNASQIDELKKNPEEIPKSVTGWQQFLKGVVDASITPIHEQAAKAIGGLGGVPQEMINKDFHPGWENERGLSAAVAGNIPSEQNNFSNWRGFSGNVLGALGSLVGLTGEVGIAGKGLKMAGVGEASATKLANLGVMSFNGYNDAYNRSLEIIGDKPEDENSRQLYSTINGLLAGVIYSYSPKTRLLSGVMGGEESKVGVDLLKGIQKSGIEFLQAPTGKQILAKYVQGTAKELGTQIGLADAQKLTEDISNVIANPNIKQSIPEDILNTTISTTVGMLIPSAIGAHGHVKSESPQVKALMFEAGSKPDVYIKQISQMLEDGQMSPENAQTAHDAILTMKSVIANTPTKNALGQDISPDNIKDYAYSMMQEHILQKKIDQITEDATNSGLKPDKAQLAPLEKKMKKLTTQREKIYTTPIVPPKEDAKTKPAEPSVDDFKAVEQPAAPTGNHATEIPKDDKTVLVWFPQESKWVEVDKQRWESKEKGDNPNHVGYGSLTIKGKKTIEQVNQAPADERSVATNHSSETEPLSQKEKTKEKVVNTEKENIPLTPQEDNSTKTNENESKQSNERGQSNTSNEDAQRSEEETKLRKPANSNGRQEQEDNRVVSEQSKTTPKGEQEQPDANRPGPTLQRPRRKIKPDMPVSDSPESKPGEIPVVSNDQYQQWDQGKLEGKPEADHKKEIEEAPNDKKIGGGESFTEFKDRIQKAWQETKKSAKDQTAMVMHSSVMKMIEAGEKHGWDDIYKLREAYNKTEEPEIGKTTTYKTDNGEVHLSRHAESEDGKNGLLRTKDTPLTKEGEVQAKEDIAGALKGEGITPPEIHTDNQPRTEKTANIVAGELSKGSPAQKAFDVAVEAIKKVGIKDNGQIDINKLRPGKEQDDLANILVEATGFDKDDLIQQLIWGTYEKIDNHVGIKNIMENALEVRLKKEQRAKEKPNQGTEPSTERRNDASSEKKTSETKDFTPPQPEKPLHEMTGKELSDYHDKLKKHNKELDKNILGEKYEEYRRAQITSNSSVASREAQKAADKKIEEIEKSLTAEQRSALFGEGLPEGTIVDEKDVRDYRDKVQYVEMAENEHELARFIAQSLVDIHNAPAEVSEMKESQKQALAAILTATRVIEERGYDSKKVKEEAIKAAESKFDDPEDAELMLSKYLNVKQQKPQQNASAQSKKQLKEGAKQSGQPEHARVEQAGSKEKAAQSANSNSNQRGKKKEKVKSDQNRHQMDFAAYNANKKLVETSGLEPRTLEEATLLHMAQGGKFIEGPEDGNGNPTGIAKHLSTRPGTEEYEAAREKWLAPHGSESKVYDKKLKKNVDAVNADKFGYNFNENGDQNEGEIGRILSEYPTQGRVYERLAEIVRERNKETNPDEPTHDITIHDLQSGENEVISLDPNDPNFESQVASIMGIHPDDMPVSFTDENHPIFQEGLAQHEAIQDAQLTKEQVQSLYDLWDKHTGDDGKLNISTIVEDLAKEKEKFDKPTQDIIDKLGVFNSDEENEPYIQKLNQKIKEYEAANSKGADEATAEGAVGKVNADGGQPGGIEEGGGEKPKPAKPTAGEKLKSDTKELQEAIEHTRKGGISEEQLNSAIKKSNELYDKAKALENNSDLESQAKRYDLRDEAQKVRDEAVMKVAPFEKVTDTEDEVMQLKSKKYNETKCRTLSKEHQKKYGGEYKEVEVTNADGSKVIHAVVVHDNYVYEPQTDALIKKSAFDEYFNTDISGKEKPNQAPADERSVATNPQPEPPAPAPKELSLVEKKTLALKNLRKQHDDLNFQKEELETKLDHAYAKSKVDPAEVEDLEKQISDKHQEIANKKKALDLKQRELEIQQAYSKNADQARKFVKKLVGDKKALSSVIPFLNGETVETVLNHAIDLYEGFQNLHIAAVRGLEWAKEKFKNEKDIDKLTEDHIKEGIRARTKDVSEEPVFHDPEHLQAAKEILEDIQSGDITYERARQEIMDEEGVYDKTKAKILNYIDYRQKQAEIGIRNAITRLKREQFGLDQEIPSDKVTYEEIWQQAKNKIEENPDRAQQLVNELEKHPRPVDALEDAILLHHNVALEKRNSDLNAKIIKAAESGDRAAMVEYQLEKAAVADKMQQAYDVFKSVGTENARGLAFRRMMSDMKFTLVNMVSEKRAAANDGVALSKEQQAEIEKLHQKIADTQKEVDDYKKQKEAEDKQREADIIKLQRQLLSARQEKGGKKSNGTSGSGNKNPNASELEKSHSISKGIAGKLRSWADKIDKAAKNQAYSSPIPVTPKMVSDALRLVADGVEKGGEILDHIQKAIGKLRGAHPDIDEGELERKINQAVINAGIVPPSEQGNSKKRSIKLKERLMSGFFKDGKLDQKLIDLNVAANRAKNEFESNIKKDEQAKLSKSSRRQDAFVKWQREFKLSNPLTLGKLTAAAATRSLITEPMEEVIGAGYTKLFSRLANGAIGEGNAGGLHMDAYVKDMTRGLMLGIKDAGKIWEKGSEGKSDLDVLFGKGGDLPPEAMTMFGQIHSMLKAPVKREKFERSLNKRLRNYAATGVDVSDPMVQTQAMNDAYIDANRAIFMQDNKVSNWYQKQIKDAERGKLNNATGKIETPNKWKGTALKYLVPFVKVPSNIVAETAKMAYGLPYGLFQVAHAYITGEVANLSTDQRDVIMRNLKKGTIGAAAIALGMFAMENFGGSYQSADEEKKKKRLGQPRAMGINMPFGKLPQWAGEAPIFQAMQFGATIQRVWHERVKGEEKGLPAGVKAAAFGLLDEQPLMGQALRIGNIIKARGSEGEWDAYIGELVKSTVVPAILDYAAKATDPADEGSIFHHAFDPENHRKPKTIIEHVESAVPGLREDLPKK